MFFLLLGNLFSWWSALKQQQTAVNSPVCIKCAFLLDSPCLVKVPLLCPPLWDMVRDSLKMGCKQQGFDTLCQKHPLVKYSGTAPPLWDGRCAGLGGSETCCTHGETWYGRRREESKWNELPSLFHLSHLWKGWWHCQAMKSSPPVSKKPGMSQCRELTADDVVLYCWFSSTFHLHYLPFELPMPSGTQDFHFANHHH